MAREITEEYLWAGGEGKRLTRGTNGKNNEPSSQKTDAKTDANGCKQQKRA
ncbi:hypothetical protein [Geomonas paludis]|uniref:hypothetical protein n=1 Tax=Geomonas paludis TaxID=2740185 RepID=UPI0016114069|nr:hypothetical protein [Geomonas paludis]